MTFFHFWRDLLGLLMMFTSSTFEGHGTLQGGWPGAYHGSDGIH